MSERDKLRLDLEQTLRRFEPYEEVLAPPSSCVSAPSLPRFPPLLSQPCHPPPSLPPVLAASLSRASPTTLLLSAPPSRRPPASLPWWCVSATRFASTLSRPSAASSPTRRSRPCPADSRRVAGCSLPRHPSALGFSPATPLHGTVPAPRLSCSLLACTATLWRSAPLPSCVEGGAESLSASLPPVLGSCVSVPCQPRYPPPLCPALPATLLLSALCPATPLPRACSCWLRLCVMTKP